MDLDPEGDGQRGAGAEGAAADQHEEKGAQGDPPNSSNPARKDASEHTLPERQTQRRQQPQAPEEEEEEEEGPQGDSLTALGVPWLRSAPWTSGLRPCPRPCPRPRPCFVCARMQARAGREASVRQGCASDFDNPQGSAQHNTQLNAIFYKR